MEIIFLGTNGWYDNEIAKTICILIKTNNFNIILDAGNGIYKLDEYYNESNPTFLFLTHFHFDHIAGLHILPKFKFKGGLKIFGPEGLYKMFYSVINAPYTISINKLPFKSSIHELPFTKEKLPFKLTSLPLMHSSLALGYRIEMEGKVITYCADTGYCSNAVTLAKNADLLVTECSLLHGEELPEWPHLNPETAAKIAKEADARKLILTHFDASRYPDVNQREKAGECAKKIFENTSYSVDFQTIKL